MSRCQVVKPVQIIEPVKLQSICPTGSDGSTSRVHCQLSSSDVEHDPKVTAWLKGGPIEGTNGSCNHHRGSAVLVSTCINMHQPSTACWIQWLSILQPYMGWPCNNWFDHVTKQPNGGPKTNLASWIWFSHQPGSLVMLDQLGWRKWLWPFSTALASPRLHPGSRVKRRNEIYSPPRLRN